ncbi:hypothetical protein [Dongia rigui]|uniref:Uncharacterized protein n=1 Tax=Dongia rigui TaxID=940149 RepID=A0ABU5E2Z7_9PROT|nr:hypothetical protein [Dongia rigui]MDY0873955.1 hypothetical protein [Dongia rigui]
MSSTLSSTSDPAPAAAMAPPASGRLSYESFLRVKQGIGSEALRAAGLPAAEHLSYDAYVAALNRKAAELRGVEDMPAARPQTKTDRADAKRIAWASLVVVPIALVFVVLVADMFKDRPDGVVLPNAGEAVAAPLTGEGLPVALVITNTEEMPFLIPPGDDVALMPAHFDTALSPPPPLPERVELLPAAAEAAVALPVPAVKQGETPSVKTKAPVAKKKAAAAPGEPAKVAAKAQKTQKTTAKPTRPSAKEEGGFWQPLLDLLHGEVARGKHRAPAPKDRSGR